MTIGKTPYDYSFDANGNLTAETTTRHFSWNHADQLTSFATQTASAEPSIHAQYLYDTAGQRVKKLVRRQGGAVEVTHYLDETFEHHRWTGLSTGENNHAHVMDDRAARRPHRVGPAHPDDRGPATAFQLADHLGSSTAVLDAAGTLTNREEYTPYGETSFGSYARKRYRFTGQERDEESRLSYHSARYCASWLARWVSCDPKAPQDGANTYYYSRDSPMCRIDPSGTDSQSSDSDSHDECHRSGCHKAREDLPASHPFNRQPALSPLIANIPDENAERVSGAVSDIWNYPLAPISLPVRAVHAVTSGLVNLGVDVGLGPLRGDPQYEALVQPLRTWGPVVLDVALTPALSELSAAEDVSVGITEVAPRGGPPVVSGTAAVNWEGGHASIEVSTGREVVHTNRLGAPGTPTEPAYFTDPVPTTATRIRLDVPDAAAAQRYQHATIGLNQGAYNSATNSCLTYCGDVLRAGGLKPPETSVTFAKWLLTMGTKE